MQAPSITIDDVSADGTELRGDVDPSSELARFFTGDPFRVSYDVPVDDVPDAILSIPILAHVCPVAWTRGADVYVDAVDASFARALEDVKATMLELYPEFVEGGTLRARRVVDASAGDEDPVDVDPAAGTDRGGSGLLFTGGVDSTCSYVRHREESPTLISVRGWTVTPDGADDGKWDHLRERVSGFARERDLETAFLESNMLEFLDHPMLLAHYKRYVDGGWYSSVGHGLGLLGLCAPMAQARGLSDLYVAATHWDGIDLEWGSRPDVDDHVRWADTRCHHDAYGLTRQQRLDVIADYVREEAPGLELQTCNVRMDGNCGSCEKCYRTAVGARLSGLDPNDHGYPFADEDYREIRAAFETGEWVLGEDERLMWEDLRERAVETEPRSSAERAFFDWLEGADFEALVSGSEPPLRHRALRAGARNVPGVVYRSLYPAYSAAASGLERIGSR